MESTGIIHDLSHQKDQHPNAPALIEPSRGKRLTYRELFQATDRTARRMATAGIEDQQRVGVLMGNRVEHVLATLGLLKRGATAVLLNHNLTDDSIDYQLSTIDVSTIISDRRFESVATSLSNVDDVFSMEEPISEDIVFLDRLNTGPSLNPTTQPGDDALIMFTSGSIGEPKPVRLSHRNLSAHANLSNDYFSLQKRDSWLTPLPFYHMGGLGPVIRSVRAGASVVIQEYEFPAILDVLRGFNPTAVSLVPTQLRRLLNHTSVFPPPSLRFLLVGGASVPVKLKKICLDNDIPLHTSYGMTETTSHVAVAGPNEIKESPEDVGARVLNGIECRVDDSDVTENDRGRGEIILEGPVVSPGYAASEHNSSGSGFRTGDVGRIDSEGRLHVDGRIDDMINSGGELISPAEVTDAIDSHECVDDVVVMGVPDEQWGEAVGALVASSSNLSPDELETFCRERLADYKIPRYWQITDTIPRTDSGSPDRTNIQRMFKE